jgi:hypothetical protein
VKRRRKHGISAFSGGGPVGGARFPHQPVVRHGAGYKLTPADRAAVARGAAFFMTGRALAKVEEICRLMGAREVIYFFLHREPEPVGEEVYVPEQSASLACCEASGAQIIRAAREIRQQGYAVLAGGHSHGLSNVYTSQTDREELSVLHLDNVARFSTVAERIEGIARDRSGRGGARAVRVSFPGTQLDVEITARGKGLAAEDLGVTLVRRWQRAVSTFSTSNARREHLVPALARITCPACGHGEEKEIPASAIAVHIIGPIGITAEERAALREELARKVTTTWGVDHVVPSVPSGTAEKAGSCAGAAGSMPATVAVTTVPAAPAPFVVWRHGKHVATLDPVVLEEAAAKVPALAEALGWKEKKPQADAAEVPREQP